METEREMKINYRAKQYFKEIKMKAAYVSLNLFSKNSWSELHI